MKKLILISALLFSFNGWAQDLPPDGKFTVNHKNGEVYLTGEVKNRKNMVLGSFIMKLDSFKQEKSITRENPLEYGKHFLQKEGS